MSYSPEKLKFFDGKLHPGSQPDALLVIPLTLVSQCITIPFGPMVTNKIGARYALLLGSWTMALGVYLSSYFTENLKIFMLFYAYICCFFNPIRPCTVCYCTDINGAIIFKA